MLGRRGLLLASTRMIAVTTAPAASASTTTTTAAGCASAAAASSTTPAVCAVAGAATAAAVAASREEVAGRVAKKARMMPSWWHHKKDTEVKRMTLPIDVLRLANQLGDTMKDIVLSENACGTCHLLETAVRDVLVVTDGTFTNDEEEYRMYLELRASAEAVSATVYGNLDCALLDLGHTSRVTRLFYTKLIWQATALAKTFAGAKSAMYVPEQSDLFATDEAATVASAEAASVGAIL
jgi:hypothetical protein